jgi:Protein of unknown function (DUF3047)
LAVTSNPTRRIRRAAPGTFALTSAPVLAALLSLALATSPADVLRLDVRSFQVVKQSSGPVNYYRVQTGPEGTFLRALYMWPLETVVLGLEVPNHFRRGLKTLRWRWRVHAQPPGGDDCQPDVGDAAAGVFVNFRAGLKGFVIKYVWNSGGAAGRSCELINWLFFAKRVVVLRSGGPLDTWEREEVDPRADFARYFGVPPDDVPDLVGLGILTDGDATRSRSEADYGDFELQAR